MSLAISRLVVLFRNCTSCDKTQFAKDNGLELKRGSYMHIRTMEDVICNGYRKIGKQENKVEIAEHLLKEGCSNALIKKITQLSTDTFSTLAQSPTMASDQT